MMFPELLLDAHADLGEGPSWDAAAKRLYWVDIRTGELHIFCPEDRTDICIPLGEKVGCVAPCSNGNLVAGLRGGFATINMDTKIITRLANPEGHLPGNRFNDGKCDPSGRFLAGTMDDAEIVISGALYSLSPNGSYKTLLTGLRISNGITWSHDYKIFYHIDTPTRQISAFDYDLATGEIAESRTVIDVPPELGWPDGMTSDSEGMLWVAMWGGAKLTRWDPFTGQLIEVFPVPALNVTSCIFGGANLTDLFITSACKGLSPEQLTKYPLSGGLFRIKTEIQGMPTFIFGG
jgi:sugar lactone lactonase YvrE